jgi:hypothetical protein
MKKLIDNLQSSFPNNLFFYLIFAAMFLTFSNMSAQKKDMMVRLSEIEIYPNIKPF